MDSALGVTVNRLNKCGTKLMPEFSKSNIPFSIEKLKKRGLTYYYIKMYYGDLYNLLKSFNISI